MGNNSSAVITGLDELLLDLGKMNKNVEKSQEKALKIGGEIFRKLMLSGINTSSVHKGSHLKNAIKVSPIKTDDDGQPYVSVGTYLGKGKYRFGVYWAHIVEGGHILKSSRSGKVIGYVSAKPFMQPAYVKGMKKAGDAMGDVIFKSIGL